MAKYRQIHVKIWKDGWFLDLPPEQKLFFIYLFSNERASIAGIYELPEAVMAFESGLDRGQIRQAFAAFSAAGKAYYEDGVVWVAKLRDYHETSSAQLQKGIQNEIDEVKDCPLKRRYLAHYGQEPIKETPKGGEGHELPFEGNGQSGEGIDRVYRPSIMSKSHSKSVSKSGDRGSGKGGVDREMLAFLAANNIPPPEDDQQRENITHPATVAWLLATGRWPGYDLLPLMIDRLGEQPSPELLGKARLLWNGSGNNPSNLVGILDWYDELRRDPGWTPADRFRRSQSQTKQPPPPASQPESDARNWKPIEGSNGARI